MDAKTKLLEEMAADAAAEKPSQDKLDRVREAVRAAGALQLQIDEKQEQLKALNIELDELLFRNLPELFVECGVRNITAERQGNLPAFHAKLVNYYRANIWANWDQQRQDKAFDLLEKLGCGDLIKRTISIVFGTNENAEFKRVWQELRKLKLNNVKVTRSVHHMTLTSMIREHYKDGNQLGSVELETLGATVGQIVDLKEANDD